MDSVKAKTNSMKKAIDEFEEREQEAKTKLTVMYERMKSGETEVEEMKRRILIVEEAVSKAKEKLACKIDHLSKVEVALAESEEKRKFLSEICENNVTRIEELEATKSLEERNADRRDREEKEVMNRLKLGEDKIQYLRSRTHKAQDRVDNLERSCEEGKACCEAMQREEQVFAERSDIMDENRRDLLEKCKLQEEREEQALRKQKTLQHAIELENERCDVKHKECVVQQRKLELLKKELGDICG